MAKICIVLATYNGEKYLSQMLDSLVAQTRPADLIIAVDDGSKDSSVQILERYKQSLPLQIEIHEVNKGHRAAFSKALETAQSNLQPHDLIALADQDDVWFPNKLEILEAKFNTGSGDNAQSAHPDLVFGDAQIIDENGNITGQSWRVQANIDLQATIKHQIAGINHVTGCLCMFRASLLKYILPIPQGVSVHDRWIAMLAQKRGGIKAIDQSVIQYRIHGENAVGGQATPSMSKTLETQKTWASTILENKDLLQLDVDEISFAQHLLKLTEKRQTQSLMPCEFFWVFRNRKFLFPRASFVQTFKRVLFTLVGLPLARKLWGKE